MALTSIERYARRVEVDEIEAYDFNLSRYVSTARQEVVIDLAAAHKGLSPLPAPDN